MVLNFPNVLKEKWKTLDLPNGSKNRISNSTFFGIKYILVFVRTKLLNELSEIVPVAQIFMFVKFFSQHDQSEPSGLIYSKVVLLKNLDFTPTLRLLT